MKHMQCKVADEVYDRIVTMGLPVQVALERALREFLEREEVDVVSALQQISERLSRLEERASGY